MMYVETGSMGLGFMKPKIIIDQLKTKLLVGHERFQSNTNDLMNFFNFTVG